MKYLKEKKIIVFSLIIYQINLEIILFNLELQIKKC